MLINNKLFAKTGIPLYGRMAKVAAAAQKATASNIANVTTPGYKAKSVDFKSEMKKLLSNKSTVSPTITDSKHIPVGKPRDKVRVAEIRNMESVSGVNNVDIEKEMMNLSENQLLYEFGAKKLARTFGVLRAAIRGRSQ
ncbi:MAG: flagellar basal body rod protein FlgB [candidate division Zixibacteria bacterium]